MADNIEVGITLDTKPALTELDRLNAAIVALNDSSISISVSMPGIDELTKISNSLQNIDLNFNIVGNALKVLSDIKDEELKVNIRGNIDEVKASIDNIKNTPVELTFKGDASLIKQTLQESLNVQNVRVGQDALAGAFASIVDTSKLETRAAKTPNIHEEFTTPATIITARKQVDTIVESPITLSLDIEEAAKKLSSLSEQIATIKSEIEANAIVLNISNEDALSKIEEVKKQIDSIKPIENDTVSSQQSIDLVNQEVSDLRFTRGSVSVVADVDNAIKDLERVQNLVESLREEAGKPIAITANTTIINTSTLSLDATAFNVAITRFESIITTLSTFLSTLSTPVSAGSPITVILNTSAFATAVTNFETFIRDFNLATSMFATNVRRFEANITRFETGIARFDTALTTHITAFASAVTAFASASAAGRTGGTTGATGGTGRGSGGANIWSQGQRAFRGSPMGPADVTTLGGIWEQEMGIRTGIAEAQLEGMTGTGYAQAISMEERLLRLSQERKAIRLGLLQADGEIARINDDLITADNVNLRLQRELVKVQEEASIILSADGERRQRDIEFNREIVKLTRERIREEERANARLRLGVPPVPPRTPGGGGGGGTPPRSPYIELFRSVALMGVGLRNFPSLSTAFSAEGVVRFRSALERIIPAGTAAHTVLQRISTIAWPIMGIGGVVAGLVTIVSKAKQLNDTIYQLSEPYANLQDAQRSFEISFDTLGGKAREAAEEFSSSFATHIGDVMQNMNKLAMVFEEKGFSEKMTLKLTSQVQEVAADAAAFFQTEQDVMQQAMFSAMNRQFRPLRLQTGILMTGRMVDRRVQEMQRGGAVGSKEQLGAYATLELIFEQLGKTAGAFNKQLEAGSVRVKQLEVDKAWKDTMAEFGKAMLPITKVFQNFSLATANMFNTWLERNADLFVKVANSLEVFFNVSLKVTEVVAYMGEVLTTGRDLLGGMSALELAAKAAAAALTLIAIQRGFGLIGSAGRMAVNTGVAVSAARGTAMAGPLYAGRATGIGATIIYAFRGIWSGIQTAFTVAVRALTVVVRPLVAVFSFLARIVTVVTGVVGSLASLIAVGLVAAFALVADKITAFTTGKGFMERIGDWWGSARGNRINREMDESRKADVQRMATGQLSYTQLENILRNSQEYQDQLAAYTKAGRIADMSKTEFEEREKGGFTTAMSTEEQIEFARRHFENLIRNEVGRIQELTPEQLGEGGNATEVLQQYLDNFIQSDKVAADALKNLAENTPSLFKPFKDLDLAGVGIKLESYEAEKNTFKLYEENFAELSEVWEKANFSFKESLAQGDEVFTLAEEKIGKWGTELEDIYKQLTHGGKITEEALREARDIFNNLNKMQEGYIKQLREFPKQLASLDLEEMQAPTNKQTGFERRNWLSDQIDNFLKEAEATGDEGYLQLARQYNQYMQSLKGANEQLGVTTSVKAYQGLEAMQLATRVWTSTTQNTLEDKTQQIVDTNRAMLENDKTKIQKASDLIEITRSINSKLDETTYGTLPQQIGP